MAASMEQASGLLSQLPLCAQQAASQGIAQSGCGLDIPCICTNEKFLTLLQNQWAQGCTAEAQDATLAAARELCLSAVPSLNDSRQQVILTSVVVIMSLATIAVILRLVSRRISVSRFGSDDALTIFALIFTYGLNVNSFVGLQYGYGLHMIQLSVSDIISFAKSCFAEQILFALSVTTTKLSLLFFYHRIFPVRKFTILSLVTGISMILWCITLVVAVIFLCKPVSYFWDKSIKGGSCINQNNFAYGISAANILTDIIVLVLPIPWLWRLQLETGKKVAIAGIFLLGSFVCVASIIRIPFLTQPKSYDVSWTIVNAGIWINVECNIGIVSACLPVMRPLFNLAPTLPRFLTFRSSRSPSGPRPWRSSKLSASGTKSGQLSNRDGGERQDSMFDGTRKLSYQLQWPQHPYDGTMSDSTQVDIYRSADKDYSDNEDSAKTQKRDKVGRNRNLWVDEHGEGESLHSSGTPPAVRDEEMGQAQHWGGGRCDVPMRTMG